MSEPRGAAAAALAALPRPALVALDLDGTLVQLEAHPALVAVPDEVHELLSAVAAASGVAAVAVVSGRALADLASFGWPSEVLLVGSHGLEVAPAPGDDPSAPLLEPAEQARRDDVVALAEALAAGAPGAWVEHKPAGVALHVRAAGDAGEQAAQRFRSAMAMRDGVWVRPGHAVVEVLVRPAGKGAAVLRLRDEVGAAGVLFAGDDVTDEDVFAVLGPADVGVKVGSGPTLARHRVDGPAGVHGLLRLLADPSAGRG